MALQVTGQLTTYDNAPLKDTINYCRLSVEFPDSADKIFVTVRTYRSRAAYLAGSTNIGRVNEINKVYVIDSVRLATLPINGAGIGAMPGKSAFDKMHYWINNEVANQIIADNPTFTVVIGDINI